MIIYITGVPGSGKTLRTMHWLEQDGWRNRLDANGKPLTRPDGSPQLRPVYSNINGDGDETLPAGHKPVPDDWRDVPDGSVIVIDEAQHRWPQRGPSKAVPEQISALDTHRHRGIDFILTTQRATGVDHHVRGLVGKHEHCRRKSGLKGCMVTMKEEAFDPNDPQAIATADQFMWMYPKHLFGSYTSSVEHTGAYKFRLPKKLLAKAAIPVLLICGSVGYAGYQAFFGDGFLPGSREDATKQAQAPAPTAEQAQRVLAKAYKEVRVYDTVTGCVTGPDICRCFNDNGHLLDIGYADCRIAARSIRWRRKAGSEYVSESRLNGTTAQASYTPRTRAGTESSAADPAARASSQLLN